MLRGVESSPASLCVEKLAWPKARPWTPSLWPSWAPLPGQQNLTDGEGRDCCPLPLPSAPSPFPKKSPVALWEEHRLSPQLTLVSPPERKSAACCRGREPYCTRLGSQRSRHPSDSISPRPEGKEGSRGVGRGEAPPTQDSRLPSSRTGRPSHPLAGDPSVGGGSRPNSCRHHAPWAHAENLVPAWPERFTWCELRGSFSASRGARLT